MSVELIKYSTVIKLFSKVSVFKQFEVESSRRGLKLEVNIGKLSLRISNYVTINFY